MYRSSRSCSGTVALAVKTATLTVWQKSLCPASAVRDVLDPRASLLQHTHKRSCDTGTKVPSVRASAFLPSALAKVIEGSPARFPSQMSS